MAKITILNTSILTEFGRYSYRPLTVEEARELVEENGFESAVGHQSTADVLTTLLGKTIPVNRQAYSQQPDDVALVFKLKGRPQEGQILTRAEIEEMGYEFGELLRIL